MITTIFDSLEEIRIDSFSLATILSAILVFLVCVLVKKLIKKLFTGIIEKSRIDGGLKTFMSSAIDIVLWAIIILIVADKLGIPTTSLVAVISIAGLALSLSVQNTLANLFSGITMLGTRPFTVGDYVDIAGSVGTVSAFGLFYTVITTVDNVSIRIPNSTVASSTITNYYTYPARRIDLAISVSYDDDIDAVKSALIEAAERTDGILADPEPFSGILSYDASSVSYALQAWVKHEEYRAVKFALTENVRRVFIERNITMTYNHINVHMIQD